MSSEESTRPQDSDRSEQAAAEPAGNPVKAMFILAALYLPLGFFLWFFFASAVAFPVARLSEWLFTGLFPDLFERIEQLGFHLEIQTTIELARRVEGRVVLLNLHINPLVYAWGIPLLFGLIMATPLSIRQRAAQMAIGFAAVWLAAVWGVFWETWKDLAFLMGPEAARAVHETIIPPTAIALCYQLGFLILPSVTPVAAWILMNRRFLEQMVINRRP